MAATAGADDWVRVNCVVEAYEAARAAGGGGIADFAPPPDDPLHLPALTELVRVELEYRWRDGAAYVEEYLDRFPALRGDPQALRELAQEEYRQRRAAGESPRPEEYLSRLGVCWDEGPAAPPPPPAEGDDPAADPFPAPGDDFAGFHLLGELGRGAFSRVYLARQCDLAARLVVLKVASGVLGESDTLAHLQHTNIVPIYSAHRCGGREAICMPYLGATTLQHLLREGAARPRPDSAQELLSTVQDRHRQTVFALRSGAGPATVAAGGDPPGGGDGPGPAEAGDGPGPAEPPAAPEYLRRRSYADFVAWLGARLAEGLAHAHDRGVLHLDLKPANVLLTPAGEPLLLDFNLAWDRGGRAAGRPRVGGTLPYMSPEQAEAFRTGAMRLDARADIYSLGAVLYQLLTGRLPPRPAAGPGAPAPPPLRRLNPAVSPALEAVVRRCLRPDPDARYRTARQLAEDLDRHFAALPLRHTREPSALERCRKWLRRHPRLASGGTVAALAALLVAAVGVAFALRGQRLARLEAEGAVRAFADGVPSVRYLLHAPHPSRAQLEEGLRLCRANLARLGALDRPPDEVVPAWLPPDRRDRLRAEVGEHLYLLARTSKRLWDCGAGRGAAPPVPAWLGWNDLAAAYFAPDARPAALGRQRDWLRGAAGATSPAAPAGAAPARGCDLYLDAADCLAAGEVSRARTLLQALLREDPQHFWGWVALGLCQDEAGEHRDAAASYGTAIALGPRHPWGYYLRGVARLRCGDDAAALADLTAAAERGAGWWEPYLSRSIAHHRRRDYAAAVADLDRALQLGGPATRIHFMKSRVRQDSGDAAGAVADFRKGLERDPAGELDWVARGRARLRTDPGAALADFDRALAVNPACLPALQNKAHVLAEVLGRPAEALAPLDALLARYPEYLPARGGRAVLLARLGRRGEAVAEVNECLARRPPPEILFQLGGVFAQTSRAHPADAERSVELLRGAVRQGWGLDLLQSDRDLDPIRSRPDFRQLLQAAAAVRARR